MAVAAAAYGTAVTLRCAPIGFVMAGQFAMQAYRTIAFPVDY
jgi:hypothetical protein